MSKRRHNFGTKRFKEKSLLYFMPVSREVADTAVCTPDCARCQNREKVVPPNYIHSASNDIHTDGPRARASDRYSEKLLIQHIS